MVASGGIVGSGVLATLAATDKTGWTNMPPYVSLAAHCMSQIDSMTLVITGGVIQVNHGQTLRHTHFYSWFSQQWTSGPDLTTSRAEHGCSFITGMDGNPTAIVAGGQVSSNTSTSTVEIFNRALNKWESGPALPQTMSLFKVLIFYHMQIKFSEKCHFYASRRYDYSIYLYKAECLCVCLCVCLSSIACCTDLIANSNQSCSCCYSYISISSWACLQEDPILGNI